MHVIVAPIPTERTCEINFTDMEVRQALYEYALRGYERTGRRYEVPEEIALIDMEVTDNKSDCVVKEATLRFSFRG